MFLFDRKLLFVAAYLLASSVAYAQNDSGTISGKVNYCDRGAVGGMQVFVPGKPHVVITGADGQFKFTDMPAGGYDLNFMFGGKLLPYYKHVEVVTDADTSLRLFNVCDAKNKLVESDAPIQINAAVFGVLDCSTEKDGASSIISHGKGECHGGKFVLKSCNSGFSDCDEDVSNGCEIDLQNDDENCGACLNACGSSESCDIGIC